MSAPVLSVGQCGFDSSSIERLLKSQFDVQTLHVSSAEQALKELRTGHFSLVLVNRVFDADGDSGIELIGRISADPDINTTPVMLVSNYHDAQAEAVEKGAVPGFGKSQLNNDQTATLLGQYLKQ